MTKQKDFTVDLSAILTDETVQAGFANFDDQLKDALIETYSPIIDQINQLYKENPNLDMSDERVADIAVEISQQLEKFNPNLGQAYKVLETDHGNYSSNMKSHLTFVLQALQNGKSLKDIKEGYEYNATRKDGLDTRINNSFKEDFGRMDLKLVDQNGDIIDPNFRQTILSQIEGEVTSKKIINAMKGNFAMSEKQAEFIVSRLTQRSIEGTGVTFKTDTPNDIDVINGPKETALVITSINSKPTLTGLEFNYTAKYIDNSDLSVLDPSRENFSKTTYKADLRPLLVHGKGLEDVPETLTYHAIQEDAGVIVPQALKHRTTGGYSDQVMQALKTIDFSGLGKLMKRTSSPKTIATNHSRSGSFESLQNMFRR